ncbi:hypothetical protein [Streptomyces sp. AD681]|uniref:hypothetical protein n=1 Tax=Streptomyces sp. AD681 TaxID=3019069 RepID=UPI0022F198C6|nr:hypothetical protein [Streptomyces sp. AD681]
MGSWILRNRAKSEAAQTKTFTVKVVFLNFRECSVLSRDNHVLPGTAFLAIGFLMVDTWSRLEAREIPAGEWIGEFGDVKVEVGGPTKVCEGFLDAGAKHVTLVSAIGAQKIEDQLVPDELGGLALRHLTYKNIVPSCMLAEGKQTGRVIILYPSSGGRLMVSDSASTPRVSGEYVEESLRAVMGEYGRCIIYVDGYTYFNRESHEVAQSLNIRDRERSHLWVDVLPHTLYRVMDVADLLYQTQTVDLLSMDLATVEGFAATAALTVDEATNLFLEQGTALAISDEDCLTIVDATGKRDECLRPAERHEPMSTPGARDKRIAAHLSRYFNQ